MFGTLTYICLDVGFNIAYWVGFKTIKGTAYSIGSIYYYISSYNYNRNNGIKAIEYIKTAEPTTIDNATTNDKDKNKNEDEDKKKNSLSDNEIEVIKSQISNQIEVIKELKTKINLLEDKLTQKEFKQNLTDELANN
jgi:hypothetical protein